MAVQRGYFNIHFKKSLPIGLENLETGGCAPGISLFFRDFMAFLRKNGKIRLSAQGPLELFKCAFFDARNIGAGDAQHICCFPLRPRALLKQAVAHNDDLSLAFIQNCAEHAEHFFGLYFAIKILGDRVVTADDINIGQRISVTVDVDGLVNGDLVVQLASGAEIHEYFIRYPAATA